MIVHIYRIFQHFSYTDIPLMALQKRNIVYYYDIAPVNRYQFFGFKKRNHIDILIIFYLVFRTGLPFYLIFGLGVDQ